MHYVWKDFQNTPARDIGLRIGDCLLRPDWGANWLQKSSIGLFERGLEATIMRRSGLKLSKNGNHNRDGRSDGDGT